MSVGIEVTKLELDARAGDTARAFQRAFEDTTTLKGYLDATTEDVLVALGYTSQEVAVLKTAVTDLAQLARIWHGLDALAAPKDFTTFVRQLWGVGAF